jgi:hypothetical protein
MKRDITFYIQARCGLGTDASARNPPDYIYPYSGLPLNFGGKGLSGAGSALFLIILNENTLDVP